MSTIRTRRSPVRGGHQEPLDGPGWAAGAILPGAATGGRAESLCAALHAPADGEPWSPQG